MIKKIKFFALVSITVIFFSACSVSTESYSFKDPNIVAYINGIPVYKEQQKQYIDIKKLYAQEIINYYNSLDSEETPLKSGGFSYNPSGRAFLKAQSKITQKYLNFYEKDWNLEYYKSIIIENQLNQFWQDKPEMKSVVKDLVDQYMDLVQETGEIPMSDGTIDFQQDINDLAEKYNLSYSECVEKIYKPFLEKENAYNFLLNDFFLDKIYNGEKVEFNESNEDAYTKYIEDVDNQFNLYIDELIDNTNIIERSPG